MGKDFIYQPTKAPQPLVHAHAWGGECSVWSVYVTAFTLKSLHISVSGMLICMTHATYHAMQCVGGAGWCSLSSIKCMQYHPHTMVDLLAANDGAFARSHKLLMDHCI